MQNPQKIYHYTSCGLDNIYLINGFHIEEDADYGTLISFEDIEGLHALIAQRLVNFDQELNGKEFRFLRKEMELSQKELAHIIGCEEQALGRWEREGKVPVMADRLVRLLYQEYYSKNPHIRDLLERVANLVQNEEQMKLTNHELRFKHDSGEWKLAA